VHRHGRGIGFLPNLDGFHLLGVERLHALILSGPHLACVNHELVGVPEPDRIAFPERIRVGLARMIAAVGIDSADLVLHLVDEPHLVRRDDELLEERLDDPARHAGGLAVAQWIELDAAADFVELVAQ
jgi:hypothetical protein